MANIECHFCTRQFDERDAKWFRPFGGGVQRDDDNALQINAAVSDQPVEGAVPICPTCLANVNAEPEPGHTLVIEKDGGRADVRKMSAAGAWEYLRDDLADIHTAYGIARNNLDPGCRVWFRHESQPDTAIRLYR
jgi:hypothetical protein